VTLRIAVLASGNGSNLQAILDAQASGALTSTTVAVVSDRPEAYALTRAEEAGVAAIALPREPGEERPAYDARLAAEVGGHQPDLVVLAGWMRVLTMAFLARFPNRVINLHPALPGEFPGTHAIERALEAHQRLGLRRTGVMVHYVPDDGVDDGPVIATIDVVFESDDSVESLSERIHAAEHTLLVDVLRGLEAE
jgi:phosphoribosylglycinamide formyltransferase 1